MFPKNLTHVITTNHAATPTATPPPPSFANSAHITAL